MNVLITGGAGFIGTHLTRHLLKNKMNVTVLDNFLPQVHGGNQEVAPDVAKHIRVVHGDVRDAQAWLSALQDADCVVHLAAETGTGQSMYEVSRYEQTNIGGTAHLFDLLTKNHKSRVERIVVASSRSIYGEGAYRCQAHDVVYPLSRTVADKAQGHFDPLCPQCGGKCEMIPTTETAPLQPSSFYGLTKQVQEQMVLMFGSVLGKTSVALRYQNVYGPGQSLDNPYTGILAIFSNLARSGRAINVFEDGNESRDFVYVEDVVKATAACISPATEISGCHALNVGSGEKTSVLDVARSINEYYGNKSEIRISGAFREGDIRHCVADLSKAAEYLQFRPSWSFSDGLRLFLEWASESEPGAGGYEASVEEMRSRGLLHG